MFNARLDGLGDNPFERLSALLGPISPAKPPILLHLGEPQHPLPEFVSEVLHANRALLGKYPPLDGTPEFRDAVAAWLTRRYDLPAGTIEPGRHLLPLSGTREGLFLSPLIAVPEKKAGATPAALMPNPFYHAYAGAALAAGAEPVYLPATRAHNFFPDLDAIPARDLARAAVFYLCTPANPQGTVADAAYLRRLLALAREHDFVLLMDECYAEIYTREAPTGTLQVCAETGSLKNVLVFHSLSKRSNAPGLRSGFVAGDPDLIKRFRTLRSYGGSLPPLPTLAASTALWRDEAHVEENRALYRRKFDIAERILGNRFGFYRPGGGFFLWLEVGDSEAAAKHLWASAGVRVLPGHYLTREVKGAANPGAAFIRIALIDDVTKTEEGLRRIAEAL